MSLGRLSSKHSIGILRSFHSVLIRRFEFDSEECRYSPGYFESFRANIKSRQFSGGFVRIKFDYCRSKENPKKMPVVCYLCLIPFVRDGAILLVTPCGRICHETCVDQHFEKRLIPNFNQHVCTLSY